MSDTKEHIVQLGEDLIRNMGYNSFSYHDISRPLDIKNAAVHYYFPKKSDLAIEILSRSRDKFQKMMDDSRDDTALNKLKQFILIYTDSNKQNKMCLIGAMITDISTFDPDLQHELKITVDDIITKLTAILKEGLSKGEFYFKETPKTKALLVITNMLASLQLTRVTGKKDYAVIEKAVIDGIIK